jgi:hypothetical protein
MAGGGLGTLSHVFPYRAPIVISYDQWLCPWELNWVSGHAIKLPVSLFGTKALNATNWHATWSSSTYLISTASGSQLYVSWFQLYYSCFHSFALARHDKVKRSSIRLQKYGRAEYRSLVSFLINVCKIKGYCLKREWCGGTVIHTLRFGSNCSSPTFCPVLSIQHKQDTTNPSCDNRNAEMLRVDETMSNVTRQSML